MTDKKKYDPTQVPSFKIPTKEKHKRNPVNYRSKQNLSRLHEVKVRTRGDVEAEQSEGIKEVLGND